ncbi:MAG: zinc-dependent metalloprotease [Acidimicrobiia bacterium]
MTEDNIFDRLIELLQSSGPVNWRLAQEIGESLSGTAEPVNPTLAAEYEELTRTAALHIADASPLEPEAHMVAVHAVDRRGWTAANLRSFRYLVEPIAEKMGDVPATGPFEAVLRPLGPALLGMQMGSMVGFMSHRVLGQFDVGLPAVEDAGIYYVVPNIEAFARDHQLDPQQTRLWVALHEVTHQAEFSVPWVRPQFLRLIEEYFDGLELDPSVLQERLEGLDDPEELERMLQNPAGIAGLLSGPEQAEVLQRIQAFMAVMEGYGDYLMDRAAPQLLPETTRLREAINRRRAEPSQGEQLLQRLLGLELKRHQYRLGAEFAADVARRWSEEALDHMWQDPENLPTLTELEDATGWAARVLL